MENAQIADIFDEIADLVELADGNQFRIRSYRNAARTIRSLPRRLEDLVAQDADLELMRWGVDVARRGWVGRSDVVNTRTAHQLRDALERR